MARYKTVDRSPRLLPVVLEAQLMAGSVEYALDYLGALPLNLSIRVQADSGTPSVVSHPESEIAALYRSVARKVAVKIAQRAKDFSAKFPTISISKDT